MDYLILFLVSGIFGYLLQGCAFVIFINANCKQKIELPQFAFRSVLFALITFLIRKIPYINFGIHTILIMAAFILISVLIFKFPVFQTTLAVILTSLVTILCEGINFGLLTLILGGDRLSAILADSQTIQGAISKAVAGIPGNIILILIGVVLYIISMKRLKKVNSNGEAGSENS